VKCDNVSVRQSNNLIRPIITQTLTGSLLSESSLVKPQLVKQLRVIELLQHILYCVVTLYAYYVCWFINLFHVSFCSKRVYKNRIWCRLFPAEGVSVFFCFNV